jgi:hypothetical protein
MADHYDSASGLTLTASRADLLKTLAQSRPRSFRAGDTFLTVPYRPILPRLDCHAWLSVRRPERRLFAHRLLERRPRSAIAGHRVVVASRKLETTCSICSTSRAMMRAPPTPVGRSSGSQVLPSASRCAAGEGAAEDCPGSVGAGRGRVDAQPGPGATGRTPPWARGAKPYRDVCTAGGDFEVTPPGKVRVATRGLNPLA